MRCGGSAAASPVIRVITFRDPLCYFCQDFYDPNECTFE